MPAAQSFLVVEDVQQDIVLPIIKQQNISIKLQKALFADFKISIIFLELKTKINKNKRLKAVFITDTGKTITRHFGFKGGSTYIDHKDKEKRKNYRKRHEVNEKKFYTDPTRPSTLSRFILWGEDTNLSDAIKSYKNKFKLK